MPTPDDPFLRFPLVAGLAPTQQADLRAAGTERALPHGTTLFREGEPAVALFGVLGGRVKLIRTNPDGRELLLHLVGPGETFAEAALFAGATCPATATAVEDTVLWAIERTRLVGMLERSPDLALRMLGAMARWTRRLAGRLEAMTQQRVEERLAAFLLSLAPRRVRAGDVLTFEDPRHLVAAQIGTGPEVLSRALRRLEDEGLARFDGRRVEVLAPDRLRSLAGWSASAVD